MARQRKIRNFLLSPLLQLRLAGALIAVMALFFAATFFFSYFRWNEILGVLIELSDIPLQAQDLVYHELNSYLAVLAFILSLQFLFVVGLVVVFTHRFLGPAHAIKKYLQKSDFSRPLKLRRGDYLQEVADCISEFVEKNVSKK